MATLIPSANVEATYEDMFKEITRKLYGEETGNVLHTLGTPVAQVATPTSGPTAPEGERSFTNLIDRSVAPTIEYEHNAGSAGNAGSGAVNNTTDTTAATATSTGNFKSEDQLSTAFGLAALMQNGFASSGTILGAQTIQKAINPSTLNTNANPNVEARWNGPIPVTVSSAGNEIVQWPTSGKLVSYNGIQKTQKSSKARDQPSSEIYVSVPSVTNNSAPNGGNTNASNVVQHSQQNTNTTTSAPSSRKKNAASATAVAAANHQSVQLQIPKRYACTHCPYSTDRRDLYTRHENIHKDEKPFQCYACLKQFNRADHVKKHFLRMHREMVYDINKTRRNVSNASSAQQQSHQIDQKPNIFLQQQQQQQVGAPVGGLGENFMTSQRQETSSSLSIAQTIESVATASHADTMPTMKQEKMSGEDGVITGVAKIKREKRFTCCYCPWSGADKWGLKRHLNTHTKPFVCMLCDYKAARSERLATHVLKVHNKKACNKCSFLADNQDEYQVHMNDVHGQTAANNSNNSGSVNTYAASDLNVTNTALNNGNTGPLQEIMVNPTSMVGWRLSANGSLIPPHDLITGGLAVNSNQKRGAERLFQYLEADGSDPEDYARLLKMDALSRNTASVAQDFHKAGGVALKNKHQFFNNTITSKQVALLHQQQKHKYKSHNLNLHSKQNSFSSSGSLSDEDNYENMKNVENFDLRSDQRKAMSAFLSRNFGLQEKVPANKKNNGNIKTNVTQRNQRKEEITQSPPRKQTDIIKQQPIKSPPAQPINLIITNNNQNKELQTNVKLSNTNNGRTTMKSAVNTNSAHKGHRLNLTRDKENSNSIFSTMEYKNLSKFGTQFQNYVKDIINKYYAETPLLFPIIPSQQFHPNSQQQQCQLSPQAKRQKLSETEEYIEYLKNKEDITLTITPKINNNSNKMSNSKNGTNIQCNSSFIQTRSEKEPRTPSAEQDPMIPVISCANDSLLTNRNSDIAISKCHTSVPIDMTSHSSSCDSRRSVRKQSQPKKIKTPPEVVMAHLRDKYLKKMVDRKKSCSICTNNFRKTMLVFPYHTPASLLLHRIWKHTERAQKCYHCCQTFTKMYSLKVHYRRMPCI